jgi:hypothetical protein
MKSKSAVRGQFRLQIGEDRAGKTVIVGDSGWCDNQITNDGFSNYIIGSLGGLGGSKAISNMGIGTGTAPASNATTLNGETGTRVTTANSLQGTKTLQATASWASGSHPGGTPTIGNLGLFNTSSGGTLCCGNTFATSAWATNQGVSCTYQVIFS